MSDQSLSSLFRPAGLHVGAWLSESLGFVESGRASGRLRARADLRAVANDNPLRVELLDWDEAAERSEAWSDLVSRAMEQNAFLEPGFALTAAQHFPPAKRPRFLMVSDLSIREERERLIGVCAIDVSRGARPFARGWLPKQAALGAPILDKTRGAEALDLIFAWIARERPKAAGLMLPAMARDGAVTRLICARAQAAGLDLATLETGERAVLFGGDDIEAMLRRAMSAKHLKEVRRQRRRLEEAGRLTYASARRPDQIRLAVERFLIFEARGWKGKRGTALLCDPAIAAFVRTMTRRLAREGKCRVESLELDGEPVAMGVVLVSGASAFLWKIAYDETRASFSPGVQFTIEFTRRQVLESEIVSTDSCAIPEHPMIDRIWPERLPIVDVAIGAPGARPDAFRSAIRRETRRRDLRKRAKRLFHALARRRRS